MILIDEREGSKFIASMPALEGHFALSRLDFEVDGQEVACGDAMLSGHGPNDSTITVGVEIKSITDLITSISSGRLGATQVPRMLKARNNGKPAYDHFYLVYFGQYRPGPGNLLQVHRGGYWRTHRFGGRSLPWAFIEGWLLTLQMFTPFRVVHLYDEHEVACWLRTFDHWLEKPWDKHKGLQMFDRSREAAALPDSDPVEAQMARTAASLPAIDYVRGWSLAHEFNSVLELVNASKEQLMRVHGIGPVIAKAFYNAVRRKKG